MIGTLGWAAAAAFCAVLVAAAWTDLRSRRIPNQLTVPALVVALVVAAFTGHLISALAGAVIGAGAFILPMFLYGLDSAGGGDVKLAAFLGAALGVAGTVNALLVGGLAAAVLVLVGVGTGRLGRRAAIPFGPFLALGGIVAMFVAH